MWRLPSPQRARRVAHQPAPAKVRRGLVAALLAVAVAACGTEDIAPELTGESRQAAELFAERCSGCHTLDVVGTEGSATNVRTREYKDGPNFNQRKVTRNCAIYAIRNGGFSSGPMPQDIVVGRDTEILADLLAKYSGGDIGGLVEAGVGAKSGQNIDCPPPE